MTPSPRSRRRFARTAPGVIACLALSAGVSVTAALSTAVPAGAVVVAPVVAAPVVVAGVQPPTPEQLEQARRDAQSSAAAAVAAQQRLSSAQAQLDVVAGQANEALERYQQAVEAQQAAQQQEVREQARLDAAEVTLSRGQKDLGQWASQTYRGGGSLPQYTGLATLLQRGASDEAVRAMATAQRLGTIRNLAVSDYRDAQQVQADAAQRAAAASEASRVRAEEATAAKKQADVLVTQQSGQVQALAQLQAAASTTALSDAARAENLAAARAKADAEAAAAAEAARAAAAEAAAASRSQQPSIAAGSTSGSSGGSSAGSGASCTGSSTTGYPNGLIPRGALCPLWGASRHVLRSDAAAAFNQLSQAYAGEFGQAICVTDSYRTLAEQVDVKQRKPGLAATPGTSRHGLGIAVDLGCGVQNYGSPQFTWLKRNAALFGWLHPAWAERQNGPFEPWHWEYTG